MKQISFKPFIKEVLINLGIMVLLSFLVMLMQVYPDITRVASISSTFIYVLPIFFVWIIYCTLFYRVFFGTITEQKKPKKAWRNFTVLFICIFIADQFLGMTTVKLNPDNYGVARYDASLTITFIFRFLMFTAYAVFYSLVRGYISQRQQKLVAEKEKATVTLQNLRSQIEPHFIFNTLNNVYALALEEHADKTAQTIEELSGLFRYTLKDSNAEYVPIQDELDFIEKYIHLHKIRLEQNENIQCSSNIQWDKKPAAIAPLLLISFIENAFKYGISMQKPSAVSITLKVEEKMLTLNVTNSINEQNKTLQNGFGLGNTKKRLNLMYEGKYNLKELNDGKTHEIHLQINL